MIVSNFFRLLAHGFLMGIVAAFSAGISWAAFGQMKPGAIIAVTLYVMVFICTRRREPLQEGTGWLDWRTKEPEDYLN